MKCRGDYKNCTKNCEWFSFGDIRWCPFQVIFVIEHLEMMQEGNWPPDPSGRVDLPIGKQRLKAEGNFTRPCQVVGEVEVRLNRLTRAYRRALLQDINNQVLIPNFSYEAECALYYITGWIRKDRPFRKWRYENWGKQP